MSRTTQEAILKQAAHIYMATHQRQRINWQCPECFRDKDSMRKQGDIYQCMCGEDLEAVQLVRRVSSVSDLK